MPLCNTYRSFAIYLLIVLLTPESPVSAFTLRISRTTTLKSEDPDLAAEGSALLEIKHPLSKLDSELNHAAFGTRSSPIRNTANILGVEKKSTFGGTKPVIQLTTVTPSNENDVTKASENKTTRKDKETAPRIIYERGQQFKARTESTTDGGVKQNITNPEPLAQNILKEGANISNTEKNVRENNQSQNENDSDYYSTSTECSESSEEKHTTDFVSSTPEKTDDTIKNNTKINNDSTTDAGTVTDEILIYKITKKHATPQTDINNTRFENDSPATVSTALTESMVGDSSSSSQDPLWKKYTVIERKRTSPTTESDSLTTEVSEELEKAESVTSKVTLENTVSTSATQEYKDLQSMSTTSEADVSSTLSTFSQKPETGTEQLPSTLPVNSETITESKSRESLASRRAGYLDLSPKKDEDEATTTELFEDVNLNETELIGSMFEIESQDNEEPEFKNSTMAESQSQLADDAIKEELLKEELMSDYEENSKRYNSEQQDNKVILQDSNSDEHLSVKPISKGALYTSRSNYKPMKKIEVQPPKPYVRDPDDNSWRNESLSYLGIVFKAKNASKPFTQVLKNKTEAELNNWSEKETKNEVPDLRERLEKITEVRKSKKKKMNQFGEMVYSDYEAENSGEISSNPKIEGTSKSAMYAGQMVYDSPPTTPSASTEATPPTTTLGVYMHTKEAVPTTTKKIKYAEYYDATDEEDADYLSLSKIDLKKFRTTRLFDKQTKTTDRPMTAYTLPMKTMLPERRPTVQYFPPRREPQKVNVNDYDVDFQRKVNMFAYSEPPKSSPFPVTMPPATMDDETTQYLKETSATPGMAHQYQPGNLKKNVYVTFPPRVVDHNNRYSNNDESYNRATYVIKHFKDLIDEAVKDDFDKSPEYMPYTEPPLMGGTVKDKGQMRVHMDDDYDYEANVRKDILNRFVDNFNQNSERFKVDFPILYNSSVVHMQAGDGGRVVASSSAFLKRQYGAGSGAGAGAGAGAEGARPCCDMKVELSPAYELHYYVPEQEEKQEAEKPATIPFNYRL